MSELRNLGRRVMNMVARGVLEADADDEPGMQQIQISLLRDEGKASVERFQNYGFSSSPPPGTEVLCVFFGGGRDHGIVVATDDRSSRFTGLKAGEVAIYSDEGDSIVFKRDNSIELHSEKKLVIKTGENVEIETKAATIKSEDSLTLEAPQMSFKGDISHEGNLDTNGRIIANQVTPFRGSAP